MIYSNTEDQFTRLDFLLESTRHTHQTNCYSSKKLSGIKILLHTNKNLRSKALFFVPINTIEATVLIVAPETTVNWSGVPLDLLTWKPDRCWCYSELLTTMR